MKITDIQSFIVGNPWKNWVFIKVYTDEGLVGVGEATSGLSAKPAAAHLDELKHLVIGEDPTQPERIWQMLHFKQYLSLNVATNAIEIACWDILGKSLNLPLWKLLGGQQRPKLRVYANGWYQGPRDPAFFAERAAAVKEMGYTALKFDPFGSAYRFLDAAEERKSLAIVASVRDAVGDDVDLCIEAHDRLSISTAKRIAEALADYRPMWLETPVMSTDVSATLELARQVDIPIATGERLHRMSDFVDLLAPRLIDIVQPETLQVGGIGRARKIAAIAEGCEAFVALHQAQSPLNTAINAHLHASIPNFLIQECFDDFLEPWSREIMSGVPRVVDGYLDVPDAPGIGVELHEAEMAKYPYGASNYLRLFDEGWERRDQGKRGL
jgi:galactonate dehydratase